VEDQLGVLGAGVPSPDMMANTGAGHSFELAAPVRWCGTNLMFKERADETDVIPIALKEAHYLLLLKMKGGRPDHICSAETCRPRGVSFFK